MNFPLQLKLMLALLLGASGCGLSDYQNRMDKERERVQQFDETNRLLDEPIEVPYVQIPGTKDEGKAWPFDVFLRLPKGYGTKVKDKSAYAVRLGTNQADQKLYPFFFRFAGGNEGAYAIFIAAASVADSNQKEEKSGQQEEKFGEYTTKRFHAFIKPALEHYCLEVLKIPPSLQEKTKPDTKEVKALTPYPNSPVVGRLYYTFFTYTDEGNKQLNAQQQNAFDVYLYVHERTARQICIVVHRPLHTSVSTLKPAIEACLSTLDLSEPVNKRTEYKKAKGT